MASPQIRERIVYLCPTRQLVNQVVEQSEEILRLDRARLHGADHSYDPNARAEYQSADRIAVTTYSALFNTNPFFDAPQIIIVDDAHAAENYIAALWSLRIERTSHPSLHSAIAGLLKPCLDSSNFSRLCGKIDDLSDATWVDKLPTPVFAEIRDEFAAILDEHVKGTDLRHTWSMLPHQPAWLPHLYLTANDLLLRPLIRQPGHINPLQT